MNRWIDFMFGVACTFNDPRLPTGAAVNYTLLPQSGDAVMVVQSSSNGLEQLFNCTASNGALPKWYINGSVCTNTDQATTAKCPIHINLHSINGSLYTFLNITPTLYPLNVKCGDGTDFSDNVTLVWIKG